jgi:hypothetical protein
MSLSHPSPGDLCCVPSDIRGACVDIRAGPLATV